MTTTTVFTSCNRFYEPFALPHILSALYHNDDVVVELCVEQTARFQRENKTALSIIKSHFPDRVLIRDGRFRGVLPNSVRFLEEPEFRSEFTYVSDIDILILEGNITQTHTDHVEKTGLPYSNILRPGSKRLTGLHFTQSSAHYPLAIPDNLDFMDSDEQILYHLVVNKGLPLPDPADTFRPMHGYHLSLNRVPVGSPDKLDWRLGRKFLGSYLRLLESAIWQQISVHFSPAFRAFQQILSSVLQTQYPDLEIYKPSDGKKLFRSLAARAPALRTPNTYETAIDDEALRNQLIKERRFREAIELQYARLAANPQNAVFHHQMAWLQAAARDIESALIFESIACKLTPNDRRFSEAATKYRTAWREAERKHRTPGMGSPERAEQVGVDCSRPLDSRDVGHLGGADSKHKQPNSSPVREAFTNIYQDNLWKGTSVSGPGSSLAATALLREELEQVFSQFGIRTLCDAACGDAGWITEVTSSLDYYFGFDIVEDLVRENLSRYPQSNHFFRSADITSVILPRADAIICRDCLVHLPLETGVSVIEKFKRSGSTYLLATTFPSEEQNGPSGVGGWRPLNLNAPPFRFPPPIRLLRERRADPNDRYNEKSLGIWRLSNL